MASSSGRSEWLFGRFVFRTRPASDVVSPTVVSSQSAGVTTLSAHSDKNCASTPDLSGGHPGAQPQRHGGVPQVVGAAAERGLALGGVGAALRVWSQTSL